MDHKKVVEFIEKSFLQPLVSQSSITDISYNGDAVYYVDNLYGRRKADFGIFPEIGRDFIRQIANLCEKQFSYQSPILDVSAEKYRINAVHQSIAKMNNDDVINFSIRIASEVPKIHKGCDFFEPGIEELFSILIKSRVSIVIGGITGTGKTEFQKYLISCMSEHTRVIVIDNVLELDSLCRRYPLDINVWQADDRNPNSSIQLLVKNALRSNPDWLIVAESRGKEMLEILNSSLTGHPVITTIHSYDINSMPTRMVRMAMMSNSNLTFQDTLIDLGYHMRFYVYLKKTTLEDGSIHRYISDIGFLSGECVILLYQKREKESKYFHLTEEIIDLLDLSYISEEFQQLFLKGKV